ncbi:MAG: TonB-dependent receptor [Burkholderiales bacterium]|nr:TonB-dependent receptor [Burkholderiales bacterium]
MKMKQIAYAVGLIGLAGVTVAHADDQPKAQDAQKVEKIEVTGSSIRRVANETALPVQTIKREDIEKTGATTVAEIVQKMTGQEGALGASASVGGTLAGFAGVSLRGLGDNHTLILVNGRRIANFPLMEGNGNASGAVDTSTLPAAAIERIDILKDGASAIYGSDAVGGVVNFILRKDYKGAEATGYYGQNYAGRAKKYQANATFGFGDYDSERYNLLVTFDHQKEDELKFKDAHIPILSPVDPSFGMTHGAAKSSNSFPANYTALNGSGSGNPALAAGCPSPLILGAGRCFINTGMFFDALPGVEKNSLFSRGTFKLTDDAQLFAEFAYSENKTHIETAPTPISNGTTALDPTTLARPDVVLPANSPYYPKVAGLSGDLSLRYRSVELGPRTNVDKDENTRFLVGAKGSFGTWDYDGAVYDSEAKATDHLASGWVSSKAIVSAIGTGQINVFGTQTNAQSLALLDSTQVTPSRVGKTAIRGGDAHISGSLFELPGGSLSVAAGVDYRQETYKDSADTEYASGDVIGGSGTFANVDASRKVSAIFGEVVIPVMKGLEADLAVRTDHYSDVGSTTNPKVSLRFQPTKQLLFRASAGNGFRAPTLADLFTPAIYTNSTANLDDPIRCQKTGSPTDCAVQATVQLGGNKNLHPEKSDQYSLGMVFSPTNTTSISVDWWKVRIRDLIGSFSGTTIVSGIEDTLAGKPALYDWNSLYHRQVPTAADIAAGMPGKLAYIDTSLRNLGAASVSGIDFDLQQKWSAGGYGKFTFDFQGTYNLSADTKLFPLDTYHNGLGKYYNGAPTERLRTKFSVDWVRGAWGANVTENHQSGFQDEYSNSGVLLDDPNTQLSSLDSAHQVASYDTVDAQVRYTGFKNLTLSLGAINLFNRLPSLSNESDLPGFTYGYTTTDSDVRGRFIYGTVNYKFK